MAATGGLRWAGRHQGDVVSEQGPDQGPCSLRLDRGVLASDNQGGEEIALFRQYPASEAPSPRNLLGASALSSD